MTYFKFKRKNICCYLPLLHIHPYRMHSFILLPKNPQNTSPLYCIYSWPWLEQQKFELHRMIQFKCGFVFNKYSTVLWMYFLLLMILIFFSTLLYCENRRNNTQNTQNMCYLTVMFSVRLPVDSRLLSFWGVKWHAELGLHKRSTPQHPCCSKVNCVVCKTSQKVATEQAGMQRGERAWD